MITQMGEKQDEFNRLRLRLLAVDDQLVAALRDPRGQRHDQVREEWFANARELSQELFAIMAKMKTFLEEDGKAPA